MFLTLMAVIAVGCVQDRALKQFDYAPGGDDGAGAVEVMDFETMDTGAEKAEVLDLEIEVVCAGGCGEQECGDDGCGGSCGSCPAPANPCHKSDCTAEHMCVESPNDGIDCDDGLWCTVDDECDEGVCVGQLDLDHCLIDGGCYQNGAIKPGNPCAECAPASALDSWSLVPDGYPCGPSAVCLGGLCCTVACGGKECGDDGCGGVCGKCPAEHHCSDGLCFEICTHECAYDGTTKCFGDAVIVCGYYDEDYCLEWGDSLPCPESSTCMDGECVCQPDCEGKQCGSDGCGGSCGQCGCGEACQPGGSCKFVNCGDKECGDNGCGGICGACGCGEACQSDGSCKFVNCDGKECGDDGCGGICGECGVGQLCEDGASLCIPSSCLGPPGPPADPAAGTLLEEADFVLVGKAQPDEIYDSNGQDVPKTNQAYAWSLAVDDERVWVGTVSNALCLVFGPLGGTSLTYNSSNAVCEQMNPGGDGPLSNPDWREPEILTYDKSTGEWVVRTEVMGADEEFGIADTTMGWRASVVFGDYYLAAGPGTGALWGMPGYGTSVAVFKSGEFLGAKKLTENNEARKFLDYGGYLYLGSQKWNADGVILRWNGDESNLPDSLFDFAEVGIIDGMAAWVEGYKGRIYAITWPSSFIGGGDGFKLYRSPLIPECGLTEEHAFEWELVFSYSDYDPNPVTNQLAGGGAMIAYQGALYFGSMHVPFQHKCASPADMINCSLEKYNNTEAFSVFRLTEDNEGNVDVECLFGEDKGGSLVPTQGPAGFGNHYNNYFWSVAVHDGWLYVGTMDYGKYLADALAAYGLPFIPGIFQPYQAFGFDLWATDDGDNWQAVGINGFGNEFNLGVRQLWSDGSSLWAGTANPFNLSSQGGWEVWRGKVSQ